MRSLLAAISKCAACARFLPHGVRPVIAASPRSRIAIIGQAPGRKVHASGVPWQDQSGDTLRAWLGVTADEFYNADQFALVPMGFCYPGTGTTGDLPPRPECAPLWHDRLFALMPEIQLTLLIGQYSQARYLGENAADSLTENVRAFRDHLPRYLPLPHPSPRNRIWQSRNPWFEKDLLPVLKATVTRVLRSSLNGRP